MWIRGNVIRNVFEAGLLWVEMFLRCIYQFAVVDEFCGEEQRSARWFSCKASLFILPKQK